MNRQLAARLVLALAAVVELLGLAAIVFVSSASLGLAAPPLGLAWEAWAAAAIAAFLVGCALFAAGLRLRASP